VNRTKRKQGHKDKKDKDKKENDKYVYDWSVPPVALGFRDKRLYERAVKSQEDLENMADEEGVALSGNPNLGETMGWDLPSLLPSPWFPGWREEDGYDYRCCRPVWDCCDYQSDFYDDWRRIEKNLWSEIKKRRAGNLKAPWGRGEWGNVLVPGE
jgi:hypothetical protein